MWDDPLFNPGEAEEFLAEGAADPEWMIEKRRDMSLHTLDVLYAKVKAANERELESLAKGVWILRELSKHAPSDVVERVLIDLRVNEMDPDFSWRKAVGVE